MATVVKEVHLKEKGISAPSTPRRILLSHGGQTTADHSPNGDIPMAKEKPKPNYLKPTISSCHDTSCGYPKSQQQQQQHAEGSIAAAGARKRLISVKSMEKPAITSSLDKTPKERTTSRTDLSLKAVPERASKAPRVGKALARAKSFPKSMPKRREANGTPSTTGTAIKPEQEEKVIFVDSGVQGHAARHGSQAPKSNTEGKHRTSPEESDSTGKPRAPPGKVSKKVCGNEGAPKKVKFLRGRERQGDGKELAVAKRLKFKQREKGVAVAGEEKPEQENVVLKRPEVKEKDEPPAYNDVIEETAAKLATRRNKVRALVGAFESVISLQEPETQPSQRQQVEAVKVGSGQPAQLKPEEEGAERGQPARAKPEKEVKVAGVECYGRGDEQQPDQEKGEKESGEEEMKGCQSVQENQPTETETETETEEEEESVIRKGEGERARE